MKFWKSIYEKGVLYHAGDNKELAEDHGYHVGKVYDWPMGEFKRSKLVPAAEYPDHIAGAFIPHHADDIMTGNNCGLDK